MIAEKFQTGEELIPNVFSFAGQARKEAVFGYPRTTRDTERLGSDAKVYLMPEPVEKAENEFADSSVESEIVPENLPLLRAMHFALDYGGHLPTSTS